MLKRKRKKNGVTVEGKLTARRSLKQKYFFEILPTDDEYRNFVVKKVEKYEEKKNLRTLGVSFSVFILNGWKKKSLTPLSYRKLE